MKDKKHQEISIKMKRHMWKEVSKKKDIGVKEKRKNATETTEIKEQRQFCCVHYHKH